MTNKVRLCLEVATLGSLLNKWGIQFQDEPIGRATLGGLSKVGRTWNSGRNQKNGHDGHNRCSLNVAND